MSRRADQKQANRVVRDRLAQERRQQRTLWTTIIAIAALVIAGLVGWGVWRSQQPDDFAIPAGATSGVGDNTGGDSALKVAGDGPVTVEVYLDFMCPACKQFETAATPTLNKLIAEQKIRLVWHTLSFLDSASTTQYSTRAASAAGCASDAGQLKAYGEALFANQPAEGGPGLSDDKLIDLGGPLGLNSPAFAACVRDANSKAWTGHVNDSAAERGVNSTPSVFVNGTLLPQPTPANLEAAVTSAS